MILNILHVMLAVFLFMTSFFLLTFLRREHVIDRTVRRMKEQLGEHSRIRQKEFRHLSDEEKKKGIFKLERMLYGSGLKKAAPFLSGEGYLLLMVFTAGGGYFLVSVLGAGIMVRLMALCAGPLFLYMVLYIRCFRNYRKIENSLILFLNLLDGFSITASEITSILYKVSRFVEEPLKELLEECYFETQITGDTGKALVHLMERVDHPRMKQIIRNLEVCSRYDADYSSVVNSSRKGIQDYLAYRKKRKSLINVAKTEMIMLLAIAVILMALIDLLLEASIWDLAFRTLPGQIMTGFLAFILLIFYCSIVLFDKG